jgi:hypothetical protein
LIIQIHGSSIMEKSLISRNPSGMSPDWESNDRKSEWPGILSGQKPWMARNPERPDCPEWPEILHGQISWMARQSNTARYPGWPGSRMARKSKWSGNRMARYPKVHESNGQESNCQESHEEDPLEKRSFGGRFLGEEDSPGDTGGKVPLQAKGTAVKS